MDYPSPHLPFKVINNYGPTENTVVSISSVISPINNSSKSPTIGHPIANVLIFILDKNIQILPVGIPGEIYISGDGVARGYV